VKTNRSTLKTPPGELALIAALRARNQPHNPSIRLGIGDDCALLRPKPGEEIAITTDFSLENVHFRRNWHLPESIGHRCLARGLSDLAAMGARPMAAFLSLAVPPELIIRHRNHSSWTERFLNGLLALAERHKVTLAGGDTAQSNQVAADIILIGAVKQGRALLRSKAKPGDIIYVTGTLGGAAAELLALKHNPSKFSQLKQATLNHPHLYPEPRVPIGLRLTAQQLATAAIDLSDGLSTDLHHLCQESSLHAEIEAAAIPIHSMAQLAQAARWAPSALELALHGGEDYELLFTANPRTKIPKQSNGVAIHPIGKMLPQKRSQPTATLLSPDQTRRELKPQGWQHFQK
jgi:thiamine-monophosphate kinase